MVNDLVQYLRREAKGYRETFLKTCGGMNATLFDQWANEVEELQGKLAEALEGRKSTNWMHPQMANQLQERLSAVQAKLDCAVEALERIYYQRYDEGRTVASISWSALSKLKGECRADTNSAQTQPISKHNCGVPARKLLMTQPNEDRNCPKCGVSSLVRNENCPPVGPTDHPETKTNFWIEEAQDLMNRGYLRDGGTQQYRDNTVEEVARAIRNAHEKGVVYGRTIGRMEGRLELGTEMKISATPEELELHPSLWAHTVRGIGPIVPGWKRHKIKFTYSGRTHQGTYVERSYYFQSKADFALPLDLKTKIEPWDAIHFIEENESYIYDYREDQFHAWGSALSLNKKGSPDPNCKHPRTQFKSINTGERFRDKYFVCEDCGVRLPYSPEIPKKDRRK